MKKKIEQKTAEAILQEPLSIKIAGKTYSSPPPTPATLIRVSKYISKMPTMLPAEGASILDYTLSIAAECEDGLAHMAATLILGVKKPSKIKLTFWKKDPIDKLAEEILYHPTNKELATIIASLLERMEIADFFSIITSLISINIAKATKEVITTKTPAPGH